MLENLKDEPSTLVFYLPVRKLPFFLQQVQETLGERQVVVAREMTKIHEEFIRGTVSELMSLSEKRILKGEAAVLVQGTTRK